MPYTDVAKNAMLTAEHIGTANGSPITHVGLATQGTTGTLTTPFGVASTDVLTDTTHGLSVNDCIVFLTLTGGTGIIIGHPYFVKTVPTGDTFTLSGTVGGPTLDFTADASAGTYARLNEVTGGSPAYARKAVTWNAAVSGTIDDSTAPIVLDVPAATTVSWVLFTSHISTSIGTAGILRGVVDVTDEVFAAQGTYTVTDADGLMPN